MRNITHPIVSKLEDLVNDFFESREKNKKLELKLSEIRTEMFLIDNLQKALNLLEKTNPFDEEL